MASRDISRSSSFSGARGGQSFGESGRTSGGHRTVVVDRPGLQDEMGDVRGTPLGYSLPVVTQESRHTGKRG